MVSDTQTFQVSSVLLQWPDSETLLSTELRNNFSLLQINTCCWRADHEILMQDGKVGVH